MPITSRIAGRLLHEAQWRCTEPVVVFESDDWGLERKPCWDLVREAGEPTDWALESTETPEDLESLAGVLGRWRDAQGRPACFTGNFVMANPDYEAIREGGFEQYVERPLPDAASQPVRAAYADVIARQCMLPQYHGLRHHNSQSMLRDFRDSGIGRKMFDAGCAAGLSFAKGHVWRYHSEYADWSDGGKANADAIDALVAAGGSHFERMFGFRSKSTIPPHYVVSDAAFAAWQSHGMRYVQGANYQIRPGAGGEKVIAGKALGQSGPSGTVLMARNVKFEPRPGRKETAKRAVAQARQMFEARIPVVIDTHRINYTGAFRAAALEELAQLLGALEAYRPLYLSTPELGEAIENGGVFEDAFTKQRRQLTPSRSLLQPLARKFV